MLTIALSRTIYHPRLNGIADFAHLQKFDIKKARPEEASTFENMKS